MFCDISIFFFWVVSCVFKCIMLVSKDISTNIQNTSNILHVPTQTHKQQSKFTCKSKVIRKSFFGGKSDQVNPSTSKDNVASITPISKNITNNTNNNISDDLHNHSKIQQVYNMYLIYVILLNLYIALE